MRLTHVSSLLSPMPLLVDRLYVAHSFLHRSVVHSAEIVEGVQLHIFIYNMADVSS